MAMRPLRRAHSRGKRRLERRVRKKYMSLKQVIPPRSISAQAGACRRAEVARHMA